MPKKRFTSEEIIHKLREAEVMSAQGRTVAEISRQLCVTEQTFFRWRWVYRVAKVDQTMRWNRDTCNSFIDRKSTRLNSSHVSESRMPSSA